MTDDMTSGEIRRTFDRIEGGQRAINDRVAELARQMVPNELWAAEHRNLQQDVTHLEADTRAALQRLESDVRQHIDTLRREIKELGRARNAERESKSERSLQVKIAVIVAVASLLAALLGAWASAILTARGIH